MLARSLLESQEGLDVAFQVDIGSYCRSHPGVQAKMSAELQARFPTPQFSPVPTVPSRGPPTRDGRDAQGRPDWPRLMPTPLYPPYPTLAKHVFGQHLKKKENRELPPMFDELDTLWDAVPEDEKADYEAQSEELRQAAWDYWDDRKRRGLRVLDPDPNGNLFSGPIYAKLGARK